MRRLIMSNPGDLSERMTALEVNVGKLEVHTNNLLTEVREIREDCKSIHGRINKLIANDLAELKRGRKFWLQIFSAGGAGVIVIEAIIRYVLSRIFGA